MTPCKAIITEGGRVVIPAPLRKQLNLHVGDEVVLHLEGQEVRMKTLRESIRQAQQLIRRYIPKGSSLADELIAERRAAAKDE